MIQDKINITDGQDITVYIPIHDANNWQLLLIWIFCKAKVYESDEYKIQYVTLFGRRYWTRKFEKTKDTAIRADEQLQKHAAKQGKKAKPFAFTPFQQAISDEIKAFYKIPGNEVGGNLHIVLDDHNLKAQHLKWCIGKAKREGDEVGVKLASKLLGLSMTQRRKIVTNTNPYA